MSDLQDNLDALNSWIDQISRIADAAERRSFLLAQSENRNRKSFDALYSTSLSLLSVDLARAQRLAEAAEWLARELNDAYASAKSLRALAHISYHRGRYREAIQEYEQSWSAFERIGDAFEVAITITSALQALIFDGQYARAFDLGARARAILEAQDNKLCLARLDSNMANIYYRQDRFSEALVLYERAYNEFMRLGQAHDIAAVLRNLGVCYISLNEFDRAQEMYEAARDHCEKNGFPLLVIRADYNVAYLYYLRGEYLRAIELYDKTRVACERLGDRYHKALCDLDESEIYLELNLTEGGEGLAHQAYLAFTDLEVIYEAAKAATFSAIALSQQGHYRRALGIFDEARRLFVMEKNDLWPALIDLYKALVLNQAGEHDESHDLASAALEYFDGSPLPAKAAICELLLADIELHFSDAETARRYCSSALARLLLVESPATYQAYYMLGRIEESAGNLELARQAYEKAHSKLEDLRSHLGKEELKIAFLKDKLTVYEGLVITTLAIDPGRNGSARALEYIEKAKSRSLADLIAFRSSSLESRDSSHAAAMQNLHDLRQKLNWVYHQIELEELTPRDRSTDRVQRLRQQGRDFESALMKSYSHVQSIDPELTGLQNASGTVTAETIQASLAEDTMMLEYFAARERFYACLITRDSIRVVPVAEYGQTREELRLLQLQIAKFRLGEDYIRPLWQILMEATTFHLRNLYGLLIEPIRQHLSASHLVIVPHGFLHYLPFQALFDGQRYLIDDFSISYAPSASVFALCQSKVPTVAQDALVLGVPDERAPHIREEAEYVAAALSRSRLFLGEQATEQQLRLHGPNSRFIHIATHGYFRQDNPMFSSLRLGSSLLSLFDIYQLQLNAELVTLSGCGTGMNVVIGGDELIGLVRGLLYAGAQTLMVSLWEVHDQSTAEFMRNFYDAYRTTPNKAEALRRAVITLRSKHPHPYYWAAFALVGKFS